MMILSVIEPEAFAGMTEKQAQKLKPTVVQKFTEKQVQEIDSLALNSMSDKAFSAIEDKLTGKQLADIAAINKVGDLDGPPEITDPSFVPEGSPIGRPPEPEFVPPVSTPSELGTGNVDPLADNISNIVSEV